MSREVRRVPPGYSSERGNPMHDETFESAATEWKCAYTAFCADPPSGANGLEFWEWHGNPPDRAYYRPWSDEEATWFQLWETVSEGTPVTPAFATKSELIEHLVAHGARNDLGSEHRLGPGWDRASAEKIVEGRYAPSFIIKDGMMLVPGDPDFP